MQIGIRADMDEALIVRIARLFQLISGLGARRSRHPVDDAIIIGAEVAQKGRQHGRGLRFGVVEQDDPVPVGNSILLATDIESGDAPALCERFVA